MPNAQIPSALKESIDFWENIDINCCPLISKSFPKLNKSSARYPVACPYP